MALPEIKIGVFDMVWHGIGCLKSDPKTHYVSLETVAECFDMDVKDFCKRMKPGYDRAMKRWRDALREGG